MTIKHLLSGTCMVAATVCLAAPQASDRLRFDGLGDLKIGQTFDEVSRLWPHEIEPVPSGLKASPDCYHVSPTSQPNITLMFQQEHLVRIDFTKAPGRTTSGVGIGDGFDALKRRYPNAIPRNLDVAAGEQPVIIASPDKRYALRFYLSQSRIDSISAGQADAVALDEGCF